MFDCILLLLWARSTHLLVVAIFAQFYYTSNTASFASLLISSSLLTGRCHSQKCISLNIFANSLVVSPATAMAGFAKVSPYAADIRAYLVKLDKERKEQNDDGKGLTDTDKRNIKMTQMLEKLSKQSGFTIKTGQLVKDFVTFEDLNPANPEHFTAIREVQAGDLLSLDGFILTFSLMCHMNDKVADPDKVCTPRQARLLDIQRELNNPGKTPPPDGYAGDNTAGWTYEVKHGFQVTSDGQVLKKTEEGPLPVVPLERVYTTIAINHAKVVDGKVQHLGRDVTQKSIRKLHPLFPTQIIKDFVASCPGCLASTKRAARLVGAATTKANGGNRGARVNPSPSHSNKRSRPEQLNNVGNCNDSSQEPSAKKPRHMSPNIGNSAQMSQEHNATQRAIVPEDVILFPSCYDPIGSGFSLQPAYINNPAFGSDNYQFNDYNLPQGSISGAKNCVPYNPLIDVGYPAQPSCNMPTVHGQPEVPAMHMNCLNLAYGWNHNSYYPSPPILAEDSTKPFNQNSGGYMQQSLTQLVVPGYMFSSKQTESPPSEPTQFDNNTHIQGLGSNDASSCIDSVALMQSGPIQWDVNVPADGLPSVNDSQGLENCQQEIDSGFLNDDYFFTNSEESPQDYPKSEASLDVDDVLLACLTDFNTTHAYPEQPQEHVDLDWDLASSHQSLNSPMTKWLQEGLSATL